MRANMAANSLLPQDNWIYKEPNHLLLMRQSPRWELGSGEGKGEPALNLRTGTLFPAAAGRCSPRSATGACCGTASHPLQTKLARLTQIDH